MGIYDRDYQRGDYYDRHPGFYLGGPRTLTTNIVIVMFVVYAIQFLTRGAIPLDGRPPDEGWFTELFRLNGDALKHPWKAFELLTYGFLHDPWNIMHILGNMIVFWFFGRYVEQRYGKREYLTFFLLSIVASGAFWFASELITHRSLQVNAAMLGASGAVTAIVVMFCLNFPHQVLYVWGVLPIPAWLLGVFWIGGDLFGALGNRQGDDTKVAFTCHIGGALFALAYFQLGWRFERLLPSGSTLKRLQPRPKLKVHDPESAEDTESAVDEILKKIQEHGRDSLTRRERKVLEDASREYQKRRH
jgi:membrane associated rhomboid family serine protease